MKSRLKLIRRLVQIAFLILFTWVLWQGRWQGVGERALSQWFLRADPLSAFVTWLSPVSTWLPLFLPAVGVLVMTLVLGRVFCGWICPLGTTIDIFDFLFLRKRTRRRPDLNRPSWKYYILAFALVAALFGTQVAWVLDPIPLLTRACATVAYPVAIGVYNVGVTVGSDLLSSVGLRLYPTNITPAFSLNLLVLVAFAAVLGLSVLSRRYWCRTLCPLGGLLAFVGRFGLLNRRVEGCVKCRRCIDECKMGAIPEPQDDDEDFSHTLTSECILCADCLVCPRPGISLIGFHAFPEGAEVHTRTSRRGFLSAVGLGLVYGLGASTSGGRRVYDEKLIRPPGAIVRQRDGSLRRMTEEQFRALCLRCGACIRACPTSGLQPAVTEGGFDGFFTPILVPRIGQCEQGCTACGDVCPSGALGQFLVEEKSRIRLGTASVDQNRCLSWRRSDLYRLCLVCDEHCPYDAIRVIDNHDGQLAPFVDPDVCVGCGMCEHVCPVQPHAAITVDRQEGEI